MSAGPLLEIEGIDKSFGTQRVLRRVSLQVMPGEFLTFLGPSGCGKTTTLRIIAGFERPDLGRVRLWGRDVTDLPPYRRDVHTVFQHYALFPHYDVFENVAFSLRLRRLPEEEIVRSVEEALSMVRLDGLERRRIDRLSGGQQQRVALARSLVGRPSLLLLDEPLGALDLKLRRQVQLELKSIQRRLGIAFIYVTHDQEEALALSDRIALLNAGEIVRVGEPRAIYENPGSSFVADFIGSANILDAVLAGETAGELLLRLEGEIDLRLPKPAHWPARPGGRENIQVAIRPERIEVHWEPPPQRAEDSIRLGARLKQTVYLGPSTQMIVSPFSRSPKELTAVVLSRDLGGPAESRDRQVWLNFRRDDVILC